MITRIPVEAKPNDLSISKARQSGLVPTIVYGPHFQPSKQMTVSQTELRKALEHKGEVFEVVIDRKKHFVKLSELQTDPVSRDPIHLSLCELPKGSKIELRIPLQIQGDPSDLHPGATILMIRDSVTLKGKMTELPEAIDVDVSNLKPGDNIRISDLELDEKALLVDDPNEVLIVCQHPHVQTTTEPTEDQSSEQISSDSHIEESLR